MSSWPRRYRLVIQRLVNGDAPAFRVVAYGEGASSTSSDFQSLSALVDALDSSGLGVTLHLFTTGSIVFAGELEMNEAQQRALGLT